MQTPSDIFSGAAAKQINTRREAQCAGRVAGLEDDKIVRERAEEDIRHHIDSGH